MLLSNFLHKARLALEQQFSQRHTDNCGTRSQARVADKDGEVIQSHDDKVLAWLD